MAIFELKENTNSSVDYYDNNLSYGPSEEALGIFWGRDIPRYYHTFEFNEGPKQKSFWLRGCLENPLKPQNWMAENSHNEELDELQIYISYYLGDNQRNQLKNKKQDNLGELNVLLSNQDLRKQITETLFIMTDKYLESLRSEHNSYR